MLPVTPRRHPCAGGASPCDEEDGRRRPGMRPYAGRVEADAETTAAVRALVEQAYAAMSTPGDDVATVFGHEDMAVAGSGQGELLDGPEEVIGVARLIAARGLAWVPEQVRVWSRGDVAWAQVLGHVEVTEDGGPAKVPYWTTGVFTREPDGWHWVYWGGSEPQEDPRV